MSKSAEEMERSHVAAELGDLTHMTSRMGLEISWHEIELDNPVHRIGIGAYGEVLRGRWHGTPVAVKRLLDQHLTAQLVDDFKSEVCFLSSVIDIGIDQDIGNMIRQNKY